MPVRGFPPPWTVVALGEDQKSECASGEARGRGGLGRQWHAAVSNRRRSAAALIVYFVVPRVPQ